jgi:EF hand
VAALAAEQDLKGDVEAGKRWLALMNHKGDKDNTISKKEFDTYINTQFDLADTDHDGTLDAAELGHLKAMLCAK